MCSLILLPMVGLAIDFGVLYNVKAKLQAAVDAAAIGAGSLVQSSTNIKDGTTIQNIKNVAQQFYNANYSAGYFGTTPLYYDATPSQDDATKIRSVYVHAAVSVPMLFMRVLRISNSTVTAQATVNIRFVCMMIVVDRSGSVTAAGNAATITNSLTDFVVNTPTSTTPGDSIFVDGRDVIGLVSFAATAGGPDESNAAHTPDFAPIATFRSASPNNIGTAIGNIPWGSNNPTNTSEGLYQAYTALKALDQIGALNVIVLLTDGRPSGFTATYNVQSTCTVKGNKTGVVHANVGTWLPPTTTGSTNVYGLFNPTFTALSSGSDQILVANSAGCKYAADSTTFQNDIANFPATDAHGNNTTNPGVPTMNAEGTKLNDPRAVRFAAFNTADNMATTIRQDTRISPTLFVIGLNEPSGEPLDADWLARVANDPNYKDTNGNSVFQAGQTAGVYYNVSSSGLTRAFQDIASQVLRLAQ